MRRPKLVAFSYQRKSSLLLLIAILAIWEVAFRIVQWEVWVFPSPSAILDSLCSMLALPFQWSGPVGKHWPLSAEGVSGLSFVKSPLLQATLISGARLVVGFSLSALLGCFFGALLWRSRRIDATLGPLLLGTQALPSVCWVPIAALTVGMNEAAILFVVIVGSTGVIALSLRDGLRVTPRIYRNAALMLGARKWNLYRYVFFPASLPALMSSLRQGFSMAWRSLMGAELVFLIENRGYGFLLAVGREFSDLSQVVAVMALMIAVSILIDTLLLVPLEKKIHSHFGFSQT